MTKASIVQRSAARGFTLIELMIAVAIVALLVAIVLPSYQESIAKSRRAEGRNALLKGAQLQERFYTTRTAPIQYANTAALPGLFGVTGVTVYSGEDPNLAAGHYTITVEAPSLTCPIASCFVLRAAPQGRHAPDAPCGDLTLSSTGVRTESGARDLDYCWGR